MLRRLLRRCVRRAPLPDLKLGGEWRRVVRQLRRGELGPERREVSGACRVRTCSAADGARSVSIDVETRSIGGPWRHAPSLSFCRRLCPRSVGCQRPPAGRASVRAGAVDCGGGGGVSPAAHSRTDEGRSRSPSASRDVDRRRRSSIDRSDNRTAEGGGATAERPSAEPLRLPSACRWLCCRHTDAMRADLGLVRDRLSLRRVSALAAVEPKCLRVQRETAVLVGRWRGRCVGGRRLSRRHRRSSLTDRSARRHCRARRWLGDDAVDAVSS